MKKKYIFIIGSVIIVVFSYILLKRTSVLLFFETFIRKYGSYLNENIKHQVTLFETILSGICTGLVTFISLFITILHENKKNRDFWKRENKKIKEERLLAVRPFLNLETKSVSMIRNGAIKEKNFVKIGEGDCYTYATVEITNNGYGKCKKIMLEGNLCSVNQLNIDESQKIDIYLLGLNYNETNEKIFKMVFEYQNIFGNSYSQIFECCLKQKMLNIEIGEPLLREGENK